MNYEKLFDPKISMDSVHEWRASGKKAMGVGCCHVPHEIIYAADVLPLRLRATDCSDYSAAEVYMSSFSCSFIKSVLQYMMDEVYTLDGIVVTDGCMQAVRLFDNYQWFCKSIGREQTILEVGAPRMVTKTTLEYYKQECEILAAEVEKMAGTKITQEKLLRAVDTYNTIRRLIKQVLELQKADNPVITGAEALSIMLASTNCAPDEYIELLEAFLADAGNRKPVEGYRARLMLIGSALDNPGYVAAIENKGGLVVCDTLCFGSLGFGDELVVDKDDVYGSIAKYYLSRVVCPRMIDNRDTLHNMILDRAKEYRVNGLIYQKMQNCECWGGENVFLEDELKAAGIPLLNLEREEKLANLGQLEIRAEAFIEMIEE